MLHAAKRRDFRRVAMASSYYIRYDLTCVVRVDGNHVHSAFGEKSLERNFLRDHESCEESLKRARLLRNFS